MTRSYCCLLSAIEFGSSLSPRKSRCLPTPCRAALGLRIQGPLEAVRYIETCTVAGRGHGFRRRGRSSSTPAKEQQRRFLVGERARERGHEFGVGLHAGKDLPLDQRRLLGQRLEIGQADIVPFGAGAARRSGPRPCARSGSSRLSSGPRRRHSQRRGTLRTCRRSCCLSTWPPLFICRSRALETRANDTTMDTQRTKATKI